MVMSIVRVVPVLVILGNCSVSADSGGYYRHVILGNDGRGDCCNGIVRLMGM